MTDFKFRDRTDSSTFVLTPMTTSDLDQVTELEAKIFPIPWSKDSFHWEIIENKYSFPFVVKENGKVIAFIILWRLINELHVANLAVDQDFRGKGIASNVLKIVFNWAIQEGVDEAHLEVRASNHAALQLYEKFNFYQVGIRKNYYQPDNEDAILMSCMLLKNE